MFIEKRPRGFPAPLFEIPLGRQADPYVHSFV